MITRKKARDWFAGVALAVLAWVFVWSAGVTFTGGSAVLARTVALDEQIRPVLDEYTGVAEFAKAMSVVSKHAERRLADGPGRFTPQRASSFHYDSVADTARMLWRQAGFDSATVAATRVLPLSRGNLELIDAAERALGGERAKWRQIELVAQRLGRGDESNESGLLDSLELARDRSGVSAVGFSEALNRSDALWKEESDHLHSLISMRDSEALVARRAMTAATIALPLSVLGLIGVWLFAFGNRRRSKVRRTVTKVIESHAYIPE